MHHSRRAQMHRGQNWAARREQWRWTEVLGCGEDARRKSCPKIPLLSWI
jgi:hypothetical protein